MSTSDKNANENFKTPGSESYNAQGRRSNFGRKERNGRKGLGQDLQDEQDCAGLFLTQRRKGAENAEHF